MFGLQPLDKETFLEYYGYCELGRHFSIPNKDYRSLILMVFSNFYVEESEETKKQRLYKNAFYQMEGEKGNCALMLSNSRYSIRNGKRDEGFILMDLFHGEER